MTPIALQQLSDLRRRTYAELIELPPVQSAEIDGFDRSIMLATYRDLLPGGESVRIAVQLVVPGRLLISSVNAWGFVAHSNGDIRDLNSPELYEFI